MQNNKLSLLSPTMSKIKKIHNTDSQNKRGFNFKFAYHCNLTKKRSKQNKRTISLEQNYAEKKNIFDLFR